MTHPGPGPDRPGGDRWAAGGRGRPAVVRGHARHEHRQRGPRWTSPTACTSPPRPPSGPLPGYQLRSSPCCCPPGGGWTAPGRAPPCWRRPPVRPEQCPGRRRALGTLADRRASRAGRVRGGALRADARAGPRLGMARNARAGDERARDPGAAGRGDRAGRGRAAAGPHLGWRAVFLVKLPVCALALALAWRALPRDGGPAARPTGGRSRTRCWSPRAWRCCLLALTLAADGPAWSLLAVAALLPLWWWLRGPGWPSGDRGAARGGTAARPRGGAGARGRLSPPCTTSSPCTSSGTRTSAPPPPASPCSPSPWAWPWPGPSADGSPTCPAPGAAPARAPPPASPTSSAPGCACVRVRPSGPGRWRAPAPRASPVPGPVRARMRPPRPRPAAGTGAGDFLRSRLRLRAGASVRPRPVAGTGAEGLARPGLRPRAHASARPRPGCGHRCPGHRCRAGAAGAASTPGGPPADA